MPNYLISMSPTKVVLRNYEGVITTYTEPQYIEEFSEEDFNSTGVAGILEGSEVRALEPKDLDRKNRKE